MNQKFKEHDEANAKLTFKVSSNKQFNKKHSYSIQQFSEKCINLQLLFPLKQTPSFVLLIFTLQSAIKQ